MIRKTEASKKIESLIADLIEKERIRKEREETEKRERLAAEARERELNKTQQRPHRNQSIQKRLWLSSGGEENSAGL